MARPSGACSLGTPQYKHPMTTVTECEVEADFGQALLNAAELAKVRTTPLGT